MGRGLKEAKMRAARAGVCFAECSALDNHMRWDSQEHLIEEIGRAWSEGWCGIAYLRDAFEALGVPVPGDEEENAELTRLREQVATLTAENKVLRDGLKKIDDYSYPDGWWDIARDTLARADAIKEEN